jgi:NAD(P)H-dependent FMN reductase
MPAPKILVIPGSNRTGSHNARLAALAAKEFVLADADVTRISLFDYPMPIYDADDEERRGAPEHAVKLKRLIASHQGIFIASPEYNASVTPLLKNAIDWVSRVRERGEPLLAAYRGRAFALGAASPQRFGGMRSLMALRQVLEIGCGALVIPEQITIAEAHDAFDESDNLKDERLRRQLRTVARRLVEMTYRTA